ncbi:hypothetical protein [Cryptosporangium phraense]|uniref:ImmA/IrrE family metallo-endopeptidase n=1 Tax=Cryptosporangium phraense TaxID=2593070 RepID=A0A545AN40_9ACTN|nr:hypothetical protein [Cryptosporangium phraense]TQS42742.1 hypothetical protein FL583_22010 [Cryptosporangium phraense]
MPDTNGPSTHGALLEKLQADFEERLTRLAAEPKRWIEFLDQAAIFGAHYSARSQLLLIAQAEERGIIPRYFLPFGNRAGTSGWKAHGRRVQHGQTAFKIWAPIRRRPTEEQAAEWEASGRVVVREESGRPAIQLVGFKLENTFELSQTTGDPFEPPTVLRRRKVLTRDGDGPQLLTGEDPTGVFDDLVRLITADGYTYERVPPRTGWLGDANGVTVLRPPLRTVQVRDDVAPAQTTKTTAHELAHIRGGHLEPAHQATSPHRGRYETEAESVAHIVLAAPGLDTSAYSDAYAFDWASGDLDLIRGCADAVLRTARGILRDLTPGPTDSEAEARALDDPGADDSTRSQAAENEPRRPMNASAARAGAARTAA